MKKLLFFTVTIFAFTTITAQKTASTTKGPTNFSIAVNAGFSTAADYKLVYGADVQADIPVANKLNVTGSVGYENFHWKVSSGATSFDGNTSQIPILAGLKAFLSTNLYAHGQIGYSVKGNSGNNNLMPNGSGFAFALSGGYNTGSWDIGIKYLATHPGGTDLGGVVARIAYMLGGKK